MAFWIQLMGVFLGYHHHYQWASFLMPWFDLRVHEFSQWYQRIMIVFWKIDLGTICWCFCLNSTYGQFHYYYNCRFCHFSKHWRVLTIFHTVLWVFIFSWSVGLCRCCDCCWSCCLRLSCFWVLITFQVLNEFLWFLFPTHQLICHSLQLFHLVHQSICCSFKSNFTNLQIC